MSHAPRQKRHDPRIWITAALVTAICAVFWLGSRYPSLQGKAGAGPDGALATPLGFEQHMTAPAPDQLGRRVLWTAGEWLLTNRQGMFFGLLLAAGILTLLPLIGQPRGGRLSGALQGTLAGVPLGVCVNCAAPVGQAMLKGGSRVEVALATMFASPSFNVVVLGILVSLFPWYLVAIKLGASLLMVLLAVPCMAALADRPGWQRPVRAPHSLPGMRAFRWLDRMFSTAGLIQPEEKQPLEGLLHSLAWVVRRYLRNFWAISRLAVPLMLLAGLLGAVLVELLPWDELARMARTEQGLRAMMLLLIVGVFGVLLPVPIAFDVVLCAVLWQAGVPASLVAVLLITLGLYSIYPWALLGFTLSWRIASLAGGVVLALGIGGGLAAAYLAGWHAQRQASAVEHLLSSAVAQTSAAPNRLAAGQSASQLARLTGANAAPVLVTASSGLRLTLAPFERQPVAPGKQVFTRFDGPVLGFERLPLPRAYQSMIPGLNHLGALATGDINNDGWPDVLMGSSFGVQLYVNLGGQFSMQAIDFPAMEDWIIGDAALVDLNGDGALDVFFTTWMHGSHILFNQNGAFSHQQRAELPRRQETIVTAAAFADVDRDGDVDIVTGSSTFQPWFLYPAQTENLLWKNRNGVFEAAALPGPQGETLSLLFTDLDADGWPELLVGNDFDEPDRLYANQQGRLVPVPRGQSPIPYSTTTTMSLDTGDLDNDGKQELYIGEIAMGRMSELAKRIAPPLAGCNVYTNLADRARCDRVARFQSAVAQARDRGSVGYCDALASASEQRDCVVMAYHWNRILVTLPTSGAGVKAMSAECDQIPADFDVLSDICDTFAGSPWDNNQSWRQFPDELPSLAHRNLLYAPGPDGFTDVTERWDAGFGGWSWNARFADLDNDTWQDLFVVQGTRLRYTNPSSIFYRNVQGKQLENATRRFGLADHRPTGAWVPIDFDLDGDQDLISYPFLLPPVVWRNDKPAAAALQLRLDDRRSRNKHGIGARIEIRSRGKQQVRELKASGGYQSHNETLAWFGLGDWPSVDSVRIHWPDGESDTLDGLALGPGRYTVTRSANQDAGLSPASPSTSR